MGRTRPIPRRTNRSGSLWAPKCSDSVAMSCPCHIGRKLGWLRRECWLLHSRWLGCLPWLCWWFIVPCPHGWLPGPSGPSYQIRLYSRPHYRLASMPLPRCRVRSTRGRAKPMLSAPQRSRPSPTCRRSGEGNSTRTSKIAISLLLFY